MEKTAFIKSSLNLNKLFGEQENYTFLVGAGISMDSPSNVPSARQIIKYLLNICASNKDQAKILDIENLSYEIFVEIFQNNIDQNLMFLDYFDLITKPNIIHFLLSMMLKERQYVITTNFDYLIEHALMKIEENLDNITLVITKKDYHKNSNPEKKDKLLLYKLHGSKRNIITKENTENSLITTISSLGRDRKQGETFAIEPYKKPAIINLMKNRTLIVLGYSGSDAFDISPTLFELPELKRIIWISHSNIEKPLIDVVNKEVDLDDQDFHQFSLTDQMLIDLAQNNPYEIYRISGNTRVITEMIWTIIFPNKNEKIPELISEEDNQIPDFNDFISSIYNDITEIDTLFFTEEIFSTFGLYKRALDCIEKGLEIVSQKNDLDLKIRFINRLAMIHMTREEYDEALNCREEALKYYSKTNKICSKADQLSSIGSIFLSKFDYDQAYKFVKRAYSIHKKLKNTYGLASDLNLLGLIFSKKGNKKKSLSYYKKGLKFSEINGDLYSKAAFLTNIGIIYYESKEYSRALPFYYDSLKIEDLLGRNWQSFIILNRIAEIHYEKKEWKKAIPNFQRALEIAENIGENDIAFIQYDQGIGHMLSYLGECSDKIGDLETSLKYYEKLLKRDELFNDIKAIKIDLELLGNLHLKLNNNILAQEFLERADNID
ncbi:tetratricopeptide repeat protein [Promethearchaeum syntrophicum]|uniref:Tetratricopeptide repeat protein n=1 Tax=Promethearchaeum syntrophicum TaxID=2594042 RepID=A0A5B9DEI2_9ARCH|nr:tetratricopeptide repeat protein [Candidatus Prometheoarchaeum syntrophicum]QEE17435.1 photosystem I assembly protein Ycf3 [Candidatus Prometheoarchaeum syntrophicum]